MLSFLNPSTPVIRWREWQARRHHAQQFDARNCAALSCYLREPRHTVRRLLASHHRYQRRLDQQRHQCLSLTQLQRLRRSFCFPQQQAYADLLAADPRSRILAAFHFGNYVYGMNALLASVAHPGLVKVLSQRGASAVHWQNIEAAFGGRAPAQEVEWLSNSLEPAALSAFLRVTGNTLILFCDLPPGNGELSEVQFLGRTAWFPKGAATLAVTNRVPLLPVITLQQGRQNHIVLLPQIESTPLSGSGERSAACIERITQSLVNLLAQVLLHSPEQWRYLQGLPMYFHAPLSTASIPRTFNQGARL